MATIKVACPKCAQRVSGDETFLGKSVTCPVCSTKIPFPKKGEEIPPLPDRPVHDAEAAQRLEEYEKTVADAKKKGEKLPEADSGADATEPPKKAVEKSAAKTEEKSAPPVPKKREPAAAPAKRRPAAPAVAGGAAAAAAAGSPVTKGPPPNSGAALWSMVFGIAAYALCPIGLLLAFPAIVFGHSGRGNIHRSMGKLGGMGMANAGLFLGYAYFSIVALIILFAPWKVPLSHVAQSYNDQSATTIITSLGAYAEENGGKYPATMEDLVPDYVPEGQLEAFKWIDPGTVPFVKRFDYTYYPENSEGDDPKAILLSAPEPDGNYRRLVAYRDGTVEILPEEDFIRRTSR